VFYPIIWVTGSEGTAALGLTQEVALTCILDIIAKVCVCVCVCVCVRNTAVGLTHEVALTCILDIVAKVCVCVCLCKCF